MQSPELGHSAQPGDKGPEALRERLRRFPSRGLRQVAVGNQDHAALPGHQGLEAEIKALDAELDELVQEAGAELLELRGVGTQVAGASLISAGDNPERLASEAAVGPDVGAGPIPASFGKTQRHRLNRGGDRQANEGGNRFQPHRFKSNIHKVKATFILGLG